MRWRNPKINIDEAFRSFLQEINGEVAEQLFATVGLEAMSLIGRIVGERFRVDPIPGTSREDVTHDIGIVVIALLRQLKAQPTTKPVVNFTAYVCTLTYNEYKNISRSKASKLATFSDSYEDHNDPTNFYQSLIDQTSVPEREAIIKEYLRHEIEGIRQLPKHQATAWLLNNKDESGNELVSRFIDYRVCDPSELGKLMGCSDECQLEDLLRNFPETATEVGRLMGLPVGEIYRLVRLAKGRLNTHRKKLTVNVPK